MLLLRADSFATTGGLGTTFLCWQFSEILCPVPVAKPDARRKLSVRVRRTQRQHCRDGHVSVAKADAETLFYGETDTWSAL